jgi:hypothetical protein
VGAKPALGLAEVFERVAAKRANERLARALDRVLGMDDFEEQACGAVLGASAIALFLADGAEYVGILALDGMAEVTAMPSSTPKIGASAALAVQKPRSTVASPSARPRAATHARRRSRRTPAGPPRRGTACPGR